MTQQPATVEVVICARATAPAGGLAVCVEALRLAGVPAPRVIHAQPGEGLARAANEALAGCEAPVLALVEDDVLVAGDWLAAAHEAWASGGDELACLGGPLELQLAGHRPAWLDDTQLPALGVHTGDELAGDVDAETATLAAGALLFRADALRGVGGFWPARGSALTRDWFGEQSHAQRELARVGWQLRYEPRLRAARRVDPRELPLRRLLRRRLQTGARASLIGAANTSRSAALAGAARSGFGAVVAAGRGRPQLAAGRSGRAAEQFGAALGARLAAADLEAVAGETPFLHTVPRRAVRVRSDRASGAPVVLCYHRVGSGGHDPLGLSVSAEHFSEQLSAIAARGPIVPLEALVCGDGPPGSVALTFDDGYADNLHVALPLLERAGAPATFFITSGHVDSGAGFWWDELTRLFQSGATAPLRLESEGQVRAWRPQDSEQQDVVRRLVHAWMQPKLPERIGLVLAQLRSWSGQAGAPVRGAEADRPLGVGELRLLAASPLVTIGAHTRTHPSLRYASPERRSAEFLGALEDLSGWLGRTLPMLAYPFGVAGVDVDVEVAEAAQRDGFVAGFVLGPAPAGSTHPMLRPRVVARDVSGEQLSEELDSLSRRRGRLPLRR